MTTRTRTAVIVTGVLVVGLGISFGAAMLLAAGAKRLAASLRWGTPGPMTITAKPDSYTSRQFRDDLLAFTRRTMVEPYDTVGERNPAWDEAAKRYLEANARAFSFQPDAPTKAQLIADGKALTAAGCTDPMVAYCYGAALQDCGHVVEAKAVLQRAVGGLEKTPYPRERAFFAPARLARLVAGSGGEGAEKEAARLRALAITWLAQAGSEVKDTGRDPQCFLTHISAQWDTLTQGSPSAVYTAMKANPKTPAYVRDVVGGWAETDEAWKARGTGWADKVSEKGWQGLQEHLESAAELLERAWQQHPEFPQAPAAMISVEMGRDSGVERERLWFSRALDAQLDYDPAFQSLLWARRPRWGGSYEEMHSLGLAALKTGRFDSGAPRWYMIAVFDTKQDQEQMEESVDVWERPGLDENLTRLCEGYAKAAENEAQRNYWRTVLAECQWLTGHDQEARKTFDELGDKADPQVFVDWPADTSLPGMRAELYARTGPAGAEVKRARELLDRGALDQVQEICAKVLAEERNPYAVEYLRYLQAEAERPGRLAKGEWVNLMPGPALLGWDATKGAWEAEPDGALRGTTDQRGLWLYKDKGIGSRVEVEGELEFVTMPDHDSGQAAITLGNTNLRDGYQYAGVRISPAYGGVMVESGSQDGTTAKETKPAPVGKKVQFRVLLWDNEVTTYINGKLVNRAVRVTSKPAAKDAGMSIGSYHPGPGAVYRFRDLRVRRLKEKPTFG